LGLIEDVTPGPVALDTAVFIYFIEEDKKFLPLLEPLFRAMNNGKIEAVTSALTLLEVLVVPYRTANLDLTDRYEALITRSRGLRFLELDRRLLRGAAQLRAAFKIHTPDALQLSAALVGDCSVFLTNDRRIPPIPKLKVLQLKAYL
jgi:predicted nucleic acid-binding protein